MHAVARTQLSFQMLLLLKKNYIARASIRIYGAANALIAQVVRAFGMSPKFGGSSPPEVETFFGTKSKSKQYITDTEFRVNA